MNSNYKKFPYPVNLGIDVDGRAFTCSEGVLEMIISELPPRQAQAVLERYKCCSPYHYIALRINTSPSFAREIVRNGVNRLKSKLSLLYPNLPKFEVKLYVDMTYMIRETVPAADEQEAKNIVMSHYQSGLADDYLELVDEQINEVIVERIQ